MIFVLSVLSLFFHESLCISSKLDSSPVIFRALLDFFQDNIRTDPKIGTNSRASLLDFESRDILSALKQLESNYFTKRAMDGLSHQVQGMISSDKKDSIQTRFVKFQRRYKKGRTKVSIADRKEASKIEEYTGVLEKYNQVLEIVQSVGMHNKVNRGTYLRYAGLVEQKRFIIKWRNIPVIVSILQPWQQHWNNSKQMDNITTTFNEIDPRFENDEILIAISDYNMIGDTISLKSIFNTLCEKSTSKQLRQVGFVSEDVMLQPTLYEIAKVVTKQITPYLDHYCGQCNNSNNQTKRDGIKYPSMRKKMRILGYSIGGAIGAYTKMLMDGTLNFNSKKIENSQLNEIKSSHFHENIECCCIAPPPCISRSVVSSDITSIAIGDDIIIRSSRDTINSLRLRLLKILIKKKKMQKKTLSALKWLSNGESVSSASKALEDYSTSKHDLTTLNMPGRVFYLKRRARNDGATIQRILRGNWKEDTLWQLHDIIVSKKALQHHNIDYIIHTLSRV